METLWGVILGWLFGLLGQRPINYIQNSIKKPALQKSIVAELKNLRCRLAMTSYLLADRTGSIDKKYLLWIKPILKTYDGFYVEMNMAEAIDKILSLEEAAFDAFIEIKKSNIDTNKSLAMKKFGMPFINENYRDLCIFDLKFQKDISEVRDQLNKLNEQIDNARFYFEKTFDSSLSPRNSEIINRNLEQSYLQINQTIMNISNHIGAISGCNLTTAWS